MEIVTEDDYRSAMAEIDRLWDSPTGTPDGDVLDTLIADVEAYEEEHYPIPLPSMEGAIEFHMERLGVVKYHYE